METIHNLLEKYLEHLEGLNYSKVTRRTISYNCLECIKWLGKTHNIITVNMLHKAHLEGWQRHIKMRRTKKGFPLKPRSINKKIENLRGLLRFLNKRGYIQKRIVDTLLYVKEPKTLPVGVLENKDMRKMLQKIDVSKNNGYRDRAILELMYSCGLRSGEVVRLNVRDVDFTNSLAKVTGKGNKERMVPIGKTALKHLETYIKAVRPFTLISGEQDAFFINTAGTRLQYHSLRILIQKHAKNAHLKEHITTHSFRRSCTTELIRGGANLYHVKELLGHEDLQSLKHYTKLTINDLRKTHAKFHPRERNHS